MAESLLIFGDSGYGKTTESGHAAEYLYERTGGRVGRYIDAGGNPKPLEPLVSVGVVEVVSVLGTPFPCTLLRKLSVGFWPTPDGQQKLRNGVALRAEDWAKPAPEVWKRVGFYIIDPLGGAAETLLEDLREQGRQIGQDVVGKWTEQTALGTETFCNNPPAHYGWVQREIAALVRQFNALPVERVIYTSHEAKGEEEDTRRAVRGPSIVGKAATDSILKNFGTAIHFEGVPLKASEQDRRTVEVRCYFRAHPDSTGTIYKCKPRVPSELDGELTKRWPGGYFVPQAPPGAPQFGTLADYMRLEDSLVERAAGVRRDWKERLDARFAGVRVLAGEKK